MIIKVIDKKSAGLFCRGLNYDEFKCKCSYDHCRSTIIASKLIGAYREFRSLMGRPLRINSGYRCNAHNMDTGGVALSRHTTGQAIDISLRGVDYLSTSDIEFAAKKAGFSYIKFYPSFVHLDVR